MKIALCLSGHLRCFEYTCNSLLNNIAKPLKCDIFIHTWDKLGYFNKFRPDQQAIINSDTNSKISIIHRIFQPKKIIIESEEIIKHFIEESKIYAPHLVNEPKSPGHMASMYYKIMQCNNLRKEYEREQSVNYDCIIRCRTDLLFNNGIMFHNLANLDKIHIPTINGYDGLNDQFAYADSSKMDIYSSLFNSIPTYFKSKREFSPEKLLKWYLNITGTQIAPINIKYQLIR